MGAFAAALGADLKFHAAPGPEPVVGHYIVTLSDSVAAELAASSAEALARAYVGQLEPVRFSHARQFAIAMLPSRARTLSADPRVREVVEVARDDDADPTPSSSLARQHLLPATRDSSSSGTYLYDGAGNITAIGSDAFVYDLDGRLVDAVVKNSEQSYTYDIYGNRLSATRGQGAVGCLGGTTCEAAVTMRETPSTTNHLANVTYDDAGNVLHGYDATYVYDGTGMVTQATVGSDIRNFAYTADDERIAVRRGASWTWTVRDPGGKVLREFTSTETSSSPLTLTGHAWSKDYVWRDGLLLASISMPSGASSPATYHYHLDQLGTPRLITRDGGTVVSSHSYYPFGSEMNLPSQENPAEAMKFTGHERDIVVGSDHSVDYMHARYYNGNLGRFLSVDPQRGTPSTPQSWNRYEYVSNNPLNRTDPTGMCGEPASFIGPHELCRYYATTTFSHIDFHDDRVSRYLEQNALNFNIANGTATTNNFGKGMADRAGVSVYFGHSNTTDGLLLTKGAKSDYVTFSGFMNRNAVVCLATCNSTEIIKGAKLRPGQALIGVTSNKQDGYVKAGDLSYIATQVIAQLKTGKTVGQIVDGLNEYYSGQRDQDPKYKVTLSVKGNRDISAP